MSIVAKPPCDEAIIGAGSTITPCPKSVEPWILAATILGSSMAFIDGTVVNVALPALQTALHATVIDVQWVVEIYALFLAALILVGGSLGDHFGRKRMFGLGIAIFALIPFNFFSSQVSNLEFELQTAATNLEVMLGAERAGKEVAISGQTQSSAHGSSL